MIVGVTQRVLVNAARGERADSLDQRLTRFVIEAGGTPVPVPNTLVAADADDSLLETWLRATGVGALVLSGGDDRGFAPERDRTEDALLDHAAAQRWPVLGICRGLQMMALRAGTPLEAVTDHVATRHVLTHAAGIDDLPGDVNSFHNFGVRSCPREFEVMASAPDGTIEAMRHVSLPWEGWMWHPERDAATAAEDRRRAARLLRAAPSTTR